MTSAIGGAAVEKIYSTGEVAAALGISPSYVKLLTKLSALAVQRYGPRGDPLYHAHHIEALRSLIKRKEKPVK